MNCQEKFRCNCNWDIYIDVNTNAWFSCIWCKQVWMFENHYHLKHLVSKEPEHLKNYYWDKLGKKLVSF